MGEAMLRIVKQRVFFIALEIALIAVPVLRAQQPKGVLPAPVPAQIYTARKVFISNGGGDNLDSYGGGPERSYNQFYAALKDWGRYELATTPAEADLILEITFSNPIVEENVSGGTGIFQVTSSLVRDGQFRLRIVDLKTHVLLWAIGEHVEPAKLQGNRDKNFDQAMASLVNDVKGIAELPQASTDSAKR
jgi:hypothetical protein